MAGKTGNETEIYYVIAFCQINTQKSIFLAVCKQLIFFMENLYRIYTVRKKNGQLFDWKQKNEVQRSYTERF